MVAKTWVTRRAASLASESASRFPLLACLSLVPRTVHDGQGPGQPEGPQEVKDLRWVLPASLASESASRFPLLACLSLVPRTVHDGQGPGQPEGPQEVKDLRWVLSSLSLCGQEPSLPVKGPVD